MNLISEISHGSVKLYPTTARTAELVPNLQGPASFALINVPGVRLCDDMTAFVDELNDPPCYVITFGRWKGRLMKNSIKLQHGDPDYYGSFGPAAELNASAWKRSLGNGDHHLELEFQKAQRNVDPTHTNELLVLEV